MTTPAILLPTTETSSAGLAVDGGVSISCVVVHPVVLLSILDHHTRRPDAAGRVIGTLLGRRDGDKVGPRWRFEFSPVSLYVSLNFKIN